MFNLGGGKDSKGRDLGKGPSSKVMGWLDARKQDRREQEYANQKRTQELFNYDQAMDQYERQLDLAPKMAGTNTADYESSAFHVPTSADEVGGGALRTQLMMSQGYNPAMEFNPYLNVFGADKAATRAHKDYAEKFADQTLTDWEASQADVAAELDASLADIRADRDKLVDDFTTANEESAAEREADMARTIVESWIWSKDSAGAMGGPGRGDDFVNRRGINGRRIQGASGEKKREYISERLASGESYADILNDQEFVDLYLSKDGQAGPLYTSQWDVEEDTSTSHETNPDWNIL